MPVRARLAFPMTLLALSLATACAHAQDAQSLLEQAAPSSELVPDLSVDAEQDQPSSEAIVSPLTTAPAQVLATQFPPRGNLAEQAFTQAQALRATAQALPTGPAPTVTLRLGDQGPAVAWLAQALAARSYLPRTATAYPYATGHAPSAEIFDAALDVALRQFQRDRAIPEDGLAGPRVYAELTSNPLPSADALDSWGRSIQAWSSEVRNAGYDRMIVVNLASFTLHAINLTNDQVEIESRVIVGKPGTRTPRMFTRVVNLKANPDWSPPKSIRGARYQRPGPNNALGLMRFSTDNNMSIYLHDTNSRGLFVRETRALSHGCVRVQQWHDLAAWAARQSTTWVDDTALVGGRTRFLKVDPIPVLLVYSRTDVVEGQASVFPDIYGLGDAGIGHAALSGRPERAPALYGLAPVLPALPVSDTPAIGAGTP